MIILIACATFASTLIGGLLALQLRDKLHLILGFSAGAVIGVAFFDLLPESLVLGRRHFDERLVTTLVAIGFLVYLILDRLVILHAHDQRSILGTGSLAIHSLLDGMAIGLAFQVSAAIGGIVAIAVLVHDFSDGVNTVSLILKGDGNRRRAFYWLLVDALAPVLGVASTLLFHLHEEGLGIVLALFCGFFLYIGASDLIPESHHAHPKFLTTVMTLLGAAVLYAAVHLSS